MGRFLGPAFLAFALATSAPAAKFDIVIYGATSGDAAAAIAAAKEGRSVALVEPSRHVGGMISGGLGRTDMDRQQNVIGGIARQFFERVGKNYGEPISWLFEPHVAEQVLTSWLRDAGVKTFLGQTLSSVTKKNSHIAHLQTSGGEDFEAPVFIDATYEGDLLKQAGVSYAIGREPRAKYGESLAGRQDILPGAHQFRAAVSPYDAAGSLLPYITRQDDVVPTGEGDGRVQSYCFRICLTDDPDNRLPHGKSDVNSGGAVSTNVPSLSWSYPEASYQDRRRIWNEHLHGRRDSSTSSVMTLPCPNVCARKCFAGDCPNTNFTTPDAGRTSFTFAMPVA
jgi:hypothetical protein